MHVALRIRSVLMFGIVSKNLALLFKLQNFSSEGLISGQVVDSVCRPFLITFVFGVELIYLSVCVYVRAYLFYIYLYWYVYVNIHWVLICIVTSSLCLVLETLGIYRKTLIETGERSVDVSF